MSPPTQQIYTALINEEIPMLVGEPLSKHTTFRIGGEVSLAVQPRTVDELITVLHIHRQWSPEVPLYILGNGSNVLFSDSGFSGIVVLTGQVRRFVFSDTSDANGRVCVTAECGASLTALAAACVMDGRALDGLAFAYGIPGTVGGAAVMNAGAYGGQMADVMKSCLCYDRMSGRVFTLMGDELDLSYRHSVFSDHPAYVVLSVKFLLSPGDANDIRSRMESYMAARREKQPLEYPNAGSVFKRPEGHFAGKLIEDCGLKGYRIGGAQVSEKHAGFIVSHGATATDVNALIAHIQDRVRARFGVDLECEIRRPMEM